MNTIYERINLLTNLDTAYKGNFYTLVGVGGSLEEYRKGYEEILAEENIGKPRRWYNFSGRQMNEHYGLRGENAYPENLTFLAFNLDGLNIAKLAIFKLKYQDRWFNDIVDNNARNN